MSKLVNIRDAQGRTAAFAKIKRQLKDAFTEEGQAAADAIRALIDEIEASEVEVDIEELKASVLETIKKYNDDESSEVPAAVANAIAKKFAAMQQAMPVSDKLTAKVKNEVSAAILRARGKDDVKRTVHEVLVKNGITGLSFEQVTDYAVSNVWGNANKLFAALNKTPFGKFYYSSQDILDEDIVAHGWDKDSETAKAIQMVEATGKTISTQYVYKRQQIAQEDLDDMRAVGGETNFIKWLNEELDNQIVNTIIATMLGASTDVTTIEPLTGTSDAFRTVVSSAALDITSLRDTCDSVYNPNGKAKWLVINQADLTSLSRFVYGTGGTTSFRSVDEMKGQLGVDEIYVTPLATVPVCFLPEGYWVKEKNAISVVYPQYDFNAVNFQKERNIGGGIHDLKSVAILEVEE